MSACSPPGMDGTDCSDGDACTTNDTCYGGVCEGGALLECDDGNDCTDDDCLATVGCVYSYNMSPCDDGDACTEADTCSAGNCMGGPALDCDDDDVCTDDSCDPAIGCTHVFNVAPCEDGDACMIGDSCVLGVCVAGEPVDCGDDDVCTDDSCDPGSGCVHLYNTLPCDDGLFCTVNEVLCGWDLRRWKPTRLGRWDFLHR